MKPVSIVNSLLVSYSVEDLRLYITLDFVSCSVCPSKMLARCENVFIRCCVINCVYMWGEGGGSVPRSTCPRNTELLIFTYERSVYLFVNLSFTCLHVYIHSLTLFSMLSCARLFFEIIFQPDLIRNQVKTQVTPLMTQVTPS